MAYDVNRCPQNEIPEFRDYFYTLIQRALGTDAGDWHYVMSISNIPPGFGPHVQADASYPLFGLTQQFSQGPKGRIFLPTDKPDHNGYFTRCIQYLDDKAGTRAKAARSRSQKAQLLTEDFEKSTKSGGLVWAWYYIDGHDYVPVQGAESGTTPPPASGGGLTEDQVNALIDDALVPVYAALDKALKLGDKTALRMDSGLFLGFVGGGPTVDGQAIQIIAKDEAHAWEMVKHEPEGAKR